MEDSKSQRCELLLPLRAAARAALYASVETADPYTLGSSTEGSSSSFFSLEGGLGSTRGLSDAFVVFGYGLSDLGKLLRGLELDMNTALPFAAFFSSKTRCASLRFGVCSSSFRVIRAESLPLRSLGSVFFTRNKPDRRRLAASRESAPKLLSRALLLRCRIRFSPSCRIYFISRSSAA